MLGSCFMKGHPHPASDTNTSLVCASNPSSHPSVPSAQRSLQGPRGDCCYGRRCPCLQGQLSGLNPYEFDCSKCVTVFMGYRALGKSVLITPFCKYKRILLYYCEVIFQRLREALYWIRDWYFPSDSSAGSALQILLKIFEQFQVLKRQKRLCLSSGWMTGNTDKWGMVGSVLL